MRSLKAQRPAATIVALAIAVGGLTLPTTALAENGNVSGTNVQAVQHEALMNLDANARGTLTIDKRQRTDTNGTTAGNGLADGSVTGDRLAGVTYKIEKLTGFDLTTQKGWEDLAALDGDVDAAVAKGVGAAQEKVTTADAATTFDNLELGAYVVTETKGPAGYTLSKPFIVTVPMTHPTELNKWNYDPIVYPKNSKTEVKKEVKDDAAPQLGDTRTYTITSDIPNLTDGETLKYYQLVDQYDSRLSLDKNKIVLKMDDGTALAAGTDYELKYVDTAFEATSAADSNVKYQAKRVTAVLTEAGRAKILKARQDGTAKKVIMTLEMTVAEKIGDNGVIRNSGYVIPENPGTEWDPEKPGTPPGPGDDEESKYGKVKITKVDSNDSNKKLKGAEFEVFRCTTKDDQLIDLGGKNFVSGDYKTVGDALKAFSVAADGTATAYGSTRFVTGQDGTITIDALQNNDWENGKKDDTPDAYCLVEKKAPEGYELQTKPIAFQILETNSTSENKYQIGAEVKNVPTNGRFKLPMTGAAGVIFLLAVGAVLILGGGFLVMMNRRKNKQA